MKIIKNISLQEAIGNLIVKYGIEKIKHCYSIGFDGENIISIFVNDIEACWWHNKDLDIEKNGNAIYFLGFLD